MINWFKSLSRQIDELICLHNYQYTLDGINGKLENLRQVKRCIY